MVVEQFLPAFHYGDAVGNSTLCFHRHLLASGVESRIVAMTIDEEMEDLAVPFSEYRDNPSSLKILHFAVPSALTDFFLKSAGKKAIIYHNITPSHFFVPFSDQLTRFTHQGREHLKKLSGVFDAAFADSEYNAAELRDLGYGNVTVFPIMIDLEQYAVPHSRGFYDLFSDERHNIIFVGRISPNKKIEDLVKVLFFYKKYITPAVRLIVAGKIQTVPKYFHAVRDLASRFHLTSEDIVFTNHIPFEELLSVYRLGDVFLSMSEHEGFCLPLIESCFFQVPVLAFAAGAVAETLDGAGMLVGEKRYDLIAAVIEKMIADPDLNSTLKKQAADRIGRYRSKSRPEGLLSLLKEI